MSLPHGRGRIHAEGITLLGGDELLVVYDSPDEATQFIRETGLLADVFRLEAAQRGSAPLRSPHRGIMHRCLSGAKCVQGTLAEPTTLISPPPP
ncbi:MAG: DUF3616 domain-containing protein [Geminicoccaceae bacterium]